MTMIDNLCVRRLKIFMEVTMLLWAYLEMFQRAVLEKQREHLVKIEKVRHIFSMNVVIIV